jgi:tetratricopeptide (TPR) repeat protein
MDPRDILANQFLKATFGKVADKGNALLRGAVDRAESEEFRSNLALTLLAFAVDVEATRAEFLSDGLDFTFQCNGIAIDPDLAMSVTNPSLSSTLTPSLARMKRALELAQSGDYSSVQLQMWDGSEGASLTLGRKSQNQARLKSSPFTQNVAGLIWQFSRSERSPMRSLGRFVTGLGGIETTPEASALRERACYAGVDLWVNRRRSSIRINLGPCLLWSSLRPLDAIPHLQLNVERPRVARLWEEQTPDPIYAVLALGPRDQNWRGVPVDPDRRSGSRLSLIVGGALYEVFEDLGLRDVCVVASSSGLQADIEQNCLICNGAYWSLIGVLRQYLVKLGQQLLQQRESLTLAEAPIASELLADLAARLLPDEPAQAEEAARASLEQRSRSHAGPQPERLSALKTLVAALQAQGKAAEEQLATREQIQIMRLVAEQHRSRRRILEAVEMLQEAITLEESLGASASELAEHYAALGQLMKENRLPNCEHYLEKAVAARDSAEAVEASPESSAAGEDQIDSLYALADQHRSRRNYPEAERQARRALELAELRHGREHPGLIPYLQLLGEVLKASGRYAEGTDFERRAVRLRFRPKP